MSTLDAFNFPPPSDWQAFQRLCRDLYAAEWQDPHAQHNGRNGQRQDGVDIYGIDRSTGKLEGIQCKGRDGRYKDPLTQKELLNAVNEAKKFRPSLTRFILATSGQQDVSLQKVARKLTEEHAISGQFEVIVESWENILRRLTYHETVARTHGYKGHWDSRDPVPAGGRDIYNVDELNIQRTYIWKRPIGNAALIMYFTAPVALGSLMGFFAYALLPIFFGVRLEFISNPFLLLAVGVVASFVFVKARAVKICHFADTMPPFRRTFLEADAAGNIFLTKLRATCPRCGARMDLKVLGDWQYHTEEVFVCTKNAPQHKIILDPTCLDEVGGDLTKRETSRAV
jgi:hypothetical protein